MKTFFQPPSLAEMRGQTIRETEHDLFLAKLAQERANANVAMLQERLARLQAEHATIRD